MKLEELTKNVKIHLEQKMNIKKSISILNIPKQALLEKGNLIILLDNNNKPIVTEFKNNQFNMELKYIPFQKTTIDKLFESDVKIFEVSDFHESFDYDYYIDYKNIKPDGKKEIRNFIKSSEKKLQESNLRFGKTNKQDILKTILVQTGFFNIWMEDHGHTIPDKKCLREAYIEADNLKDFPLKKRAALSKCFYKISQLNKG